MFLFPYQDLGDKIDMVFYMLNRELPPAASSLARLVLFSSKAK